MFFFLLFAADVDVMDTESDEDDSPIVFVAGKPMPIDEIKDNTEIIAQMTEQERDAYILAYQERYVDEYD